MSQIKLDNKLKEELVEVCTFLTDSEGADVVEEIDRNLRIGKMFEDTRVWLEEILPKSNETKMQRKMIDVLCDNNVLGSLPPDMKENAKKIVERVKSDKKSFLTKKVDLDAAQRELDKLVDRLNTIRGKFQKLDEMKAFSSSLGSAENTIHLEVGMGATTATAFALVVLVTHYLNGVL